MENFKFITHDNRDAYFNIASEEYLLKQTDDYYVYLWINDNAVIVGVNQNTLQEVNLAYTESKGIKVVRRLTGGGAVFHDNGNLCYTIIAPYDDSVDNYKKFTKPVIEYLNELGVKAEFSGRNDIVVDGKKISGNAQTVYNKRIMHHGTILFDSDMANLTRSLNPNKLKIESKGIKSVRARVTNVKKCLNNNFTIEQFKSGLAKKFEKIAQNYSFTLQDKLSIQKLIDQKYSTYEWNISRSPKGKNIFERKFSFGIFTLTFDMEKGKIQNAQINGDFFSLKDVQELERKLNGITFTKEDFVAVLKDVDKFIKGASLDEIINEMFSE